MKQNLLLDVQFDEESDSGSSAEPVDIDDVKAWLKIDVDDDDTLLQTLITAARKQCETFLCISLIPKTISAILQNELDNSRLPYGPVGEIQSINDRDDADISTDSYELLGNEFKWISATSNCFLKIVYTAGYTTCPNHFKTAILQQVAYLYENRGDAGKLDQLSPIVTLSLKPYRRVF